MMNKVIITTPEELEQMLARIIKGNLTTGSFNPKPPEKQILSIDEASQLLGIPKNTLYGYTSRRLIPHQKVGRSLKFRKEELVAWLDDNKRRTIGEIRNEK